jgi:phosphatidylserine decarboxylase
MSLLKRIVSTHFPFQRILNKGFVKIYDIDLSEYAPLENYNTLQEIFTRRLLMKRVLGKGVISPVDGFISQYGLVKNGTILHVKGISYDVKELLQMDRNIDNWKYVIFYLSPKNYHRYHAPCNMNVHKLVHIPGKLFPVNDSFLKYRKSVFVENERVILECSINKKKFFLIFIGAFGVGSINFNFEKDVNRIKVYSKPIKLKKGEELGFFGLGSTVVILFESLKINVKKGSIRFGDSIGK